MPPHKIPVQQFRRELLAWYRKAHRRLPWRETKDPYRVWLSEIMLQQTRVSAALPYYERFLQRFPTIEALAGAHEQDLLAAWSGLGYYSRARNMQSAAKQVVKMGGFPRDYEGIRALPGIGDYTAAAIASVCFDLPHVVLDGNVLRVISRLTNDAGDIQSSSVKARMRVEAQRMLDPDEPALFNQALMELGALLCLPRSPQCLLCPVHSHCAAQKAGTQTQLPVKLRKAAPVEIEKALLLIRRNGSLLLWQRGSESSRMAGFWELPEREQMPDAWLAGPPAAEVRHTITRHRYTFAVYRAEAVTVPVGFVWVPVDALAGLPLSTVARKALGAIP
jgi:A/G-specific adenine glycosylase